MATFGQFIQLGPINEGTPIAGWKLYHYVVGTTSTLKDVYTDRAKTTPAAQPVVADSRGIMTFYADGLYKFVVKSPLDVELYTWDGVSFVDAAGFVRGEGVALASASNLVLGNDGDIFHITGTNTINTLTGDQTEVTLVFDSALQLTHSSTLIMSDGQNRQVAAGDVYRFFNEGGGVFREIVNNRLPILPLTTDGDLAVLASSKVIRQAGVLGGRALIGGKVIVTMSGNAVTLAVKTDAGNDPSATEPVWYWCRSSTLTDGSYVLRKITGALSTTISSGSTGGTVSGVASRVYVNIIDNAGTPELSWHQTVDVSGSPAQLSLKGFNESALVSTTAEGGAGAADSAGVMYSTTARSGVAFCTVAYFESTQATAGTWASAATVVQQMRVGIPRTGDIIQRVGMITGAVATGTTVLPDDDTIPQNTEGNQYMSQAITPLSGLNLLLIETEGMFAHTVGAAQFGMALFQDSTANALAAMGIRIDAAADPYPLRVRHLMRAGTTSSTTFNVRAGSETAGTTTFNGEASARKYGGVYASYVQITEIVT